MGKWEMVRLGDAAHFTMGQSPSSESYNDVGEGIPFFQGKSDFGLMYPTVRMFCTDPKKVAEIDDILISVRAPVGAVNIATETCCIGRGLAAISQREKLSDYKYIYYYLKYKEADVANMGVGSTFKAISKKDLDIIEIPLPPLPVQLQIADVLDRTSALIEKRKAQIEKLDLLVKAQFTLMFGDPVTNTKGWEIKKLSKLFDVGSSKRIYQRDLVTNGVPFLRVSDLVQRIKTGNCSNDLYISEELYSEFEQKALVPQIGDILVTSRGTLGLCYVITDTDKFYFQDGMISWLRKKEVKIDNAYITNLFAMNGFRKQIDEIPAGSTVNYLSIARLKKLDVMYPDFSLQKEFTTFAQTIEAQKSLLQQSLAKLELSYKSLMQKCFRGEIF